MNSERDFVYVHFFRYSHTLWTTLWIFILSIISLDIKKKPFNFIMASYFYKNNSGDYSPAEIAVAKFNFEDAVYKFYHSFINPGK